MKKTTIFILFTISFFTVLYFSNSVNKVTAEEVTSDTTAKPSSKEPILGQWESVTLGGKTWSAFRRDPADDATIKIPENLEYGYLIGKNIGSIMASQLTPTVHKSAYANFNKTFIIDETDLDDKMKKLIFLQGDKSKIEGKSDVMDISFVTSLRGYSTSTNEAFNQVSKYTNVSLKYQQNYILGKDDTLSSTKYNCFTLNASGSVVSSMVNTTNTTYRIYYVPAVKIRVRQIVDPQFTPLSVETEFFFQGTDTVKQDAIIGEITLNGTDIIDTIRYEIDNQDLKIVEEDGKVFVKVANPSGLTRGKVDFTIKAISVNLDTEDIINESITVAGYKQIEDVKFTYKDNKNFLTTGEDALQGQIGNLSEVLSDQGLDFPYTIRYQKNDKPGESNNNDMFTVTEDGIVSLVNDVLTPGDYKLSLLIDAVDDTGASGAGVSSLEDFVIISVKDPLSNLGLSYNNSSHTNEFMYGDAAVKKSGIIGTLSVADVAASDVTYKLVDKNGNDTNNTTFQVNGDKLEVTSANDLNVGSYSFYVKATVSDGRDIIKNFTFTVKKKEQTMDWNAATKKITDKYYGDSFVIGVDNVIGSGISPVYGMKVNDSCVTLNSNTGAVSVTCVPASDIIFTASASGNDNYEDKIIEKVVSIKKRPIILNTKLKDGSNKYVDKLTINYGDNIPDQSVVLGSGSGSMGLAGVETISSLGTPTYKFMDGNTVVNDPNLNLNKTYQVDVSFNGGTSAYYDITVEKAELEVTASAINDADYFTVTGSKHPDAADNTWFYDDVTITPIHDVFTEMDINNANSFQTTGQVYGIEGDTQPTLIFRKPGTTAVQTTAPHIKIDKTKPTVTDITYTKKSRNALQEVLNAVSFDHFFREEQIASFTGNDIGGSGLDTFEYTIVELDESGNEKTATKQTAKGNSVDLGINKNYKITVYAIDNAGNRSDTPKVQTVSISDQNGVLDIKAYTNHDSTKMYDGSAWTKDNITVELSCSNPTGVKEYQYSTDGNSFTKMTDNILEIPNTSNINNVTYTFKAIGNNGVESLNTLVVKLDKTVPEFDVLALSNGASITSGDNVEGDVTFDIDPVNTNISQVTYYYTNDEAVSHNDPLSPTSGWSKMNGTLNVHDSGTVTYYFVAVSGAKAISNIEDFTFTNERIETSKVNVTATSNGKSYTQGTWTNHDVTFTLSGGMDQPIGYEVAITGGEEPSAGDWKDISTPSDFKHIVIENLKDKTFWFRIKDMDETRSDGFKVCLDVEKPGSLTMDAKGKNDKKDIKYDTWINQEVMISVKGEDNYTSSDDLRFEYTIGNSEAWQSYNGRFTLKNGTSDIIRVRAIDQAGNISEPVNSKTIMIDTEAPKISGVSDNGKYRSAIVHLEDMLSGIDYDKTTVTVDGSSQKLANDTTFDKDGVYKISVYDKAGNHKELTFTITSRTEEISDEETGGSISGVDTDFDIDTELIIVNVTNEYKNAKLDLKKDQEIKEVYDVKMTLDGKEIQPDGKVKVRIKYKADEHTEVYEIDANGNKKKITYRSEGEYIIFETDALSKYAIVGKKEKVCNADNLNNDTDGDGLPDINIDLDHDCSADLNIDINGDKIPDVNIDTIGDGKADINIDINDDGKPDVNVAKITKWVPDKDCEYEGMKYDTMANIKPEKNVDTDGDGKPDKNIDDEYTQKSVKGSSVHNALGGANTGDTTKWRLWLILLVVTIVLMIYSYHKNKKDVSL